MKTAAGFVFNSEINIHKLGNLFSVLERNQATGKLKLEQGVEQITLLFVRGRPFQTWTSWTRSRIGELLLERGVLSEACLESALEIQQHMPHLRLGDVLMNSGSVCISDLTALLAEQALAPLEKVVKWSRCRAVFDSMPNVLSPLHGLPIEAPLSQHWDKLYSSRPTSVSRESSSSPFRSRRPTDELKRVCTQLKAANSTTDWASTLLTYALTFYSRSALFYRSSQGWRGYALARAEEECSRPSGGGLDRGLKNAHLPSGESSLFDQVAVAGCARGGALPANDWNRQLVGSVGGGWPADYVAIPVGGDDQTELVLYADTSQLPPGSPMRQALFQAASAARESLHEALERRKDNVPRMA